MKSYFVYISSILLVLGLANCTKEITEDLFLGFSIDATYENDAFLEFPHPTELSITENRNTPIAYTLSYRNIEGSGYYKMDGTTLNENTKIALDSINFTIQYIGTTTGTHVTEVTIHDEKNRTQTATLQYEIKDNAFVMDIAPATANTFVNGTIPLTQTLKGTNSGTYTTEYKIVTDNEANTGTGILSLEGTTIQSNTPIATTLGNSIWEFEGVTEGITTLVFTTKSSFGITATNTVTITISKTPDFKFTATTTTTEVIKINTPSNLNFELEVLEGETEYVMTYASSATGTFAYKGIPYTAGDQIPITTGITTGTYTGMTKGTHKLSFTVSTVPTPTQSLTAQLEIAYRDPITSQPTITLNGPSSAVIEANQPYTELGATATDANGNTLAVTTSGTVNTALPNVYTIVYTAVDVDNNSTAVTRTVTVRDTSPPQITITGGTPTIITAGDAYTDAGATAQDTVAGTILVTTTTNTVNATEIGSYEVSYSATDTAGNTATATRVVHVRPDYSISTTSSADNTICNYPKPDSGILPIQIKAEVLVPWVVTCHMMDNDLESGWVMGGPVPVQFDLGYAQAFNQLEIAFRATSDGIPIFHNFGIEVSNDGITWTTVLANVNSQKKEEVGFEQFNFQRQNTRFVRYVANGSSDKEGWTYIREIRIHNRP